MSVPQYTTPTFMLTFTEENLDLTAANNVYVTFKSRNYTLTKTTESLTIEAKSIGVHLTQQDTSKFVPGYVEIQANWTTLTGDRAASEVVEYPIDEQLLLDVVQ